MQAAKMITDFEKRQIFREGIEEGKRRCVTALMISDALERQQAGEYLDEVISTDPPRK
jgi:hypothetical protein